MNVSNIQYSADGQFVYFLGKLNNEKLTTLYRIPVNGGQAQSVLSLKDTSISSYALSPKGNKVALLAMPAKPKSDKKLKELGFKAEVYEEGLTNKQLFISDLTASDKPLSLEALPVDDYVSAVEWSPNANQLLVKTQPSALIDDQYMKSAWH